MAWGFDNQRTEASQSTISNYSFALWAQGYNADWTGSGTGSYTFGGTTQVYAPINVLSSGSLFTVSNFLTLNNFLTLSAWETYDGNLNIGLDVTRTLYQHASFSLVSGGINFGSTPSSMLLVDIGTTSGYLNINISGSSSFSDLNYPTVKVYYGKPWQTNGSSGTGSSTFVTSFSSPGSMSFDYNYTYNSTSGSYLYFILLNGCGAC